MAKPVSIVTGACGFIGSHMVEVLAEAGHEIIGTDIQSAWETEDPKKLTCVNAVKNAGVTFIPSDMTKPDTIEKLPTDVDYVFHIASIFSYKASWQILYKTNVKGTMNLVRHFLKGKNIKRFVLWGAGGVYGLPQRQEIPFMEDVTMPDPCNNYLKSKCQQEYYVILCGKKHGLPYTIIRPTTVYGPRGIYGSGQLLIGLAMAPVLFCPANFTGRIPFVHVRDVARAALHLALCDSASQEIYNVNDDSTMTTIEFFKFMAKLRGKRCIIIPPIPIKLLKKLIKAMGSIESFISADLLKKEPLLEVDGIEYLNEDFVYSNDKLKSTGFHFLYPDPREGIKETIKWYIDNGWMK